MPSEPTYTQDLRAGFLGRIYPQMNDRAGGGRIDTYGTQICWFDNSYCTWGPFRSNNGYGYGSGNDAQRFTFYNSGSASKGIDGFPHVIDYVITEDSGDYYISWGKNISGSGFDTATKNTLPVNDDHISETVIGTVVTFDNSSSVMLTSDSVRGLPTGLGDYIGTFSPGSEPSYITSITPA